MRHVFCPFCQDEFVLLSNDGKLDCGHKVSNIQQRRSELLKRCTQEAFIDMEQLMSKGHTAEEASNRVVAAALQVCRERNQFETSLNAPYSTTNESS